MTPDDPSRSTSSPPEAKTREARARLRSAFNDCRTGTIALIEDLADADFRSQPHPDFSPAGWHLGHVAYTEAKWLICHLNDAPLPRPEMRQTFDVDGLPKAERSKRLPPKDAVLDYAHDIRGRIWHGFDDEMLKRDGRVWHFVLQHESQHGETITFLRHLLGDKPLAEPERGPEIKVEFLPVPAGAVPIGSDALAAIDNERPAHAVAVGDFRIARHPVTQGQFAAFIEAGGYTERRWWDEDGWAWLKKARVGKPLYWHEDAVNHPVMGVNAFEAEAFARFSGARLPTEAEWEKAAAWNPETGTAAPFPWGETLPGPEVANCDRVHKGTTPVDRYPMGRSAYGAEDMIGNVWEWTASSFMPYDGFTPWPYADYSKIYFDGAHRVLRGGSWATRPWAMRASFRNWYTPDIRQILAGFRLAKDGLRD